MQTGTKLTLVLIVDLGQRSTFARILDRPVVAQHVRDALLSCHEEGRWRDCKEDAGDEDGDGERNAKVFERGQHHAGSSYGFCGG